MLTKESVLYRIEGIESGANSSYPKPFHPDHLLIEFKTTEEKELILGSILTR
jgi:DNA-binding response OmpR family regulator